MTTTSRSPSAAAMIEGATTASEEEEEETPSLSLPLPLPPLFFFSAVAAVVAAMRKLVIVFALGVDLAVVVAAAVEGMGLAEPALSCIEEVWVLLTRSSMPSEGSSTAAGTGSMVIVGLGCGRCIDEDEAVGGG